MKHLFLISIFLIRSALASTGGTDVGGGGETVDVRGRPTLRDLVDKTVCVGKSGDQMIASLPHFEKILASVAKANWYFAEALRDEGRKLTVCLTQGDLKQIPTEDQLGLTIYEEPNGRRQLAVRINGVVYIDAKLFRQLSPEVQAYVYVHEVMHSFIPMDSLQRNAKLRSMVAAIHENQLHPMTREVFRTQLSLNSIAFTSDSKELELAVLAGDLDRVKAAIEKGADSNAKIIFTHPMGQNYVHRHSEQMSVVSVAILKGFHEMVRYLAAQPDFDPNSGAACKFSPLSLAAAIGDIESIHVLLAHPAILPNQNPDVSLAIEYGQVGTALFHATENSKLDAVEALLADPRVDPNQYGGFKEERTMQTTGLCYATRMGDIHIVAAFLRHPSTNFELDCSVYRGSSYTRGSSTALEWAHLSATVDHHRKSSKSADTYMHIERLIRLFMQQRSAQ